MKTSLKTASVMKIKYTNPALSAEELVKLSQHKAPIVRLKVALHPSTPKSVLERLAQDDYESICAAVASNISTPVETLAQLARKKRKALPFIQMRVAQNPNASAEILAELAQSPHPPIRAKVAEHPNTSADTLKKLAADADATAGRLAKRELEFTTPAKQAAKKATPSTALKTAMGNGQAPTSTQRNHHSAHR